MNIQEREELDFQAGTELENCLQEARAVLANLNGVSWAAISAQVALGRFVVVTESPFHCRATDAVAGTLVEVVSGFSTRTEAEAKVAKLVIDSGDDHELSCFVLPKAPRLNPIADVAREESAF